MLMKNILYLPITTWNIVHFLTEDYHKAMSSVFSVDNKSLIYVCRLRNVTVNTGKDRQASHDRHPYIRHSEIKIFPVRKHIVAI